MEGETSTSNSNDAQRDGSVRAESGLQGQGKERPREEEPRKLESVSETMQRLAKAVESEEKPEQEVKQEGKDSSTDESEDSSEPESEEPTKTDKKAKKDEKPKQKDSDDRKDESEEYKNAPSSWNAEEKLAYKDLPLEARKAVHRRTKELEGARARADNERHRLSMQLEEIRSNTIEKKFEKYFSHPHYQNQSPDQVIENLISMDLLLGRDLPSSFAVMAQVAKQHNMTPQQYVDYFDQWSDAGGQNGKIEPVPSLRTQKQEKSEIEIENEKLREQLQNVNRSKAETFIQEFASEKDTEGNLVRPFFIDMEREISVQLPAIERIYPDLSLQEQLHRAYEAVVYSNPSLRSKIEAYRHNSKNTKQRTASSTQSGYLPNPNPRPSGGYATRPTGRVESVQETMARIMSK